MSRPLGYPMATGRRSARACVTTPVPFSGAPRGSARFAARIASTRHDCPSVPLAGIASPLCCGPRPCRGHTARRRPCRAGSGAFSRIRWWSESGAFGISAPSPVAIAVSCSFAFVWSWIIRSANSLTSAFSDFCASLLSSISPMPPIAASLIKVLSSWLSAALADAPALWPG